MLCCAVLWKDHITSFSLALLRDRNFADLEEDIQGEVLSLFVDDNDRPSKEGRKILAINAFMLANATGEQRLAELSMDLLLAWDKTEVREILARIAALLQDYA